VRHSSLEAARAAVERLGYRPVVPEKASRVSHLHAVAFQKPDRPELDLHAFALAEDPSPDADSGFFERAVPFETEWGTEETLSAADHLLCAGVHGLRFANPPSVHWAADAVMIVRRAGSPALWQTLVDEAGRRKLSLWAFRSLKLVGEAFGAPVPAEALDALERDSADRTQRLELAARMRPPSLARGLFLHWRGLARERPGHSRLRRLGAFPRYLSELWELDSVREVPAAAARKSARRLGKRGLAGR